MGQRILESVWKTWKDDHLLSLTERSKLNLKSLGIEATDTQRVGNTIQLKDDLPR